MFFGRSFTKVHDDLVRGRDELLRVFVRGAVELGVQKMRLFEFLLDALHLLLIFLYSGAVTSYEQFVVGVETFVDNAGGYLSVPRHDASMLYVVDRGGLDGHEP